MGGLAAAISSAVTVVNAQTASLQVQVIHEPWVGDKSGLGESDYGSPVGRSALVQEGVLHHKKPDGQVITTKARISFLGPVEPNGALGRQEPIDPRDNFTLPSGLTGQIILEVPGVLLNPETNAPYVRTVWLA